MPVQHTVPFGGVAACLVLGHAMFVASPVHTPASLDDVQPDVLAEPISLVEN